MTTANPLSCELESRAIRLHRYRRAVDAASRIGLPAVAGLFVAMLLNGLGVLPPIVVKVTGIAAVVVVLVAAAASYSAPATANQALVALGRSHGLADAVRTALELDRFLAQEQNPTAAAFVRAHIQQTHRKLAEAPTSGFMPAHLVDRLQVIAVLGLCIISTALL